MGAVADNGAHYGYPSPTPSRRLLVVGVLELAVQGCERDPEDAATVTKFSAAFLPILTVSSKLLRKTEHMAPKFYPAVLFSPNPFVPRYRPPTSHRHVISDDNDPQA